MTNSICIIPARGGSKRIPRKNIRSFHGQPMIAYAIQCAQKSKLFDRIIVSTDDQEIAEVSASFGAEVPFLRSEDTANDFATTSAVLIEVLTELQQTQVLPEWICCLYPTTPLLLAEDLHSAQQLLQSSGADVVLAAAAFDFPIQRAFELNKEGRVQLREPAAISARSQDLPKTFHDAGAFYFFRTASFLREQNLWSGNIVAHPLPAQRVQDIDQPEDWELAQYKFQRLQENG
ncbi:MAG: pseudaminic acid cytidylyltransferase [Flavobacteriales bacterium]